MSLHPICGEWYRTASLPVVLLAVVVCLSACGKGDSTRSILLRLEKDASGDATKVLKAAEFQELIQRARKDPHAVAAVARKCSPVCVWIAVEAVDRTDHPARMAVLSLLWVDLADRIESRVAKWKKGDPQPVVPADLRNACSRTGAVLLGAASELGQRVPEDVFARLFESSEKNLPDYTFFLARMLELNPAYVGDPTAVSRCVALAEHLLNDPTVDWAVIEPLFLALGHIAVSDDVEELRRLEQLVPEEHRAVAHKAVEAAEGR